MKNTCPVRHAVDAFYQNLTTHQLWVGFSGGMDSTVLLHALAQAKPSAVKLNALHIHHGLQSEADHWLVHCEAIASQFDVGFLAKKVAVDVTANLEAAARQARYQAFSEVVEADDVAEGVIVTAHHQRDQAETFLLNLMRGAGVAGLSAMPVKRPLINQSSNQAWLVRPLLSVTYQALLEYANSHRLSWVEDPMNQQTDFRRNFIRQQILPLFNQVWLQPEQKITQASEHCSEANNLLDTLAQIDLQAIDQGSNYLDWQAIQSIDWPRQKNLLRYWFILSHHIGLTQSDLDWFRHECFAASSKANPQRILGGKVLKRFNKFIFYPVEKKQEFLFIWREDIDLTSINSMLQNSLGKGVAQHWFNQNNKIEIRCLKPTDSVNRASLKKWFQSHKIPPWEREVWPVMMINDQPAAIRDYRVFEPFSAKPNEMGVKFVALN